MTKSLYLIGAPGVGKSTLMDALLEPWTPLESEMMEGLLRGHRLLDRLGSPRGVYLGRLREHFPGTDALSYSAGPAAERWLKGLRTVSAHRRPVILAEGARLGTESFLTALSQTVPTLVVHLTASEDALAERRAARGSDQSPSWMRGAATRAANAASRARAAGAFVVDVDTSEMDTAELAGLLGTLRA